MLIIPSSREDMEARLGEIRAYVHEYEEHKKALENGEPFERRLPAKKSGSKLAPTSRSKKRKNTRSGKKTTKRRRASDSDFEDDDEDDDDFIDDDSDSSASEEESDGSESEDNNSDSSGSDASDKESNGEEDQMEVEDEEVTVESLEEKIKEAKEAIKAGRTQLSEYRKQKKGANDKLAALKKKQMKVQRDKNAFCSLKRSEVRTSCSTSWVTPLTVRAVLPWALERRLSRWTQGVGW